ncbi:hypothetical protein Mgra_00007955 [Meloidogyne graminicola]|uniref:ornithine decarboxylase n=1 Tax=Meloidogyne graminicola TaxID=189291 RepID=A0A8S9ZHD4_9BILA|nr:hypothetical protein Mgra_00007955 [Meloidogyne graminicola]
MIMNNAFEPVNYEIMAGKEIAIFEHLLHENGGEMASLAICRRLTMEMDAKGIDDAFSLYNLDVVVQRLLQWKELLPRVKPFYAVKCNNDSILLRLLSDLGCGFDCASKGEIDQIISEGLATCERIIYANPCKTRSYIQHADKNGIRRMTFDSLEELLKIKENHSSPQLVLRISVSDPTAQCPLATKFGCDPLTEGPILIKQAKQINLQIIGISFHVGSGCRDPTAFKLAISASKKLFDFGILQGHPMSLLDIGGGFPGFDTEQISFGEIVEIIQRSLDEHFPVSNDVEIIAEPGRYFASAPVSLCANLISVTKVSATRVTKRLEDSNKDGQMLYINDGVYGSFNCILFDHFHPWGQPLFKKRNDENNASSYIPTIIWGQTCDGLDQIEENTKMPKMEVGDWIFYKNMGAYTNVAASNFNGFETPKSFYIFSKQFWNFVYNKKRIEINKEEKIINEFYNKNGLINDICKEFEISIF